MKIVHFLYVKKLFLEDGLNNLLKIVLCTATMGSLVMGTSISWSGPALPLLELGPAQDGFSIDKSQASWVGSLMPLGQNRSTIYFRYAVLSLLWIWNFFDLIRIKLA